MRRNDGSQCKHQAEQGGYVLAEHDDQCTTAALTEPLEKAAPVSLLVDLTHASPQRDTLRDNGKYQHPHGDPG